MNFICSGIEPDYDDNEENEFKQCRECRGLYYGMVEGLCIGCYDKMTTEQLTEQLEDK